MPQAVDPDEAEAGEGMQVGGVYRTGGGRGPAARVPAYARSPGALHVHVAHPLIIGEAIGHN